MQQRLTEILAAIKPYVLSWISGTGGGSGPYAPSPHDLNSAHHSGSIADSQAPQFLLSNGGRALTGNLPVSPGVTIDGVDVSDLAAIPFVTLGNTAIVGNERALTQGSGIAITDGGAGGAVTVSVDATVARDTWPVNAGAGLTGGGNLAAGGVTITVGAGAGITVNADDVALTTPGSLSVSSTNSSTGNHTHAIASSSNPGAAASLLASSASGYLQLVRLGAGVAPTVPLQALATTEQLRLNYDAINYAAFIVGLGGDLTLAPTGDLILDPTGNDVLPNTNYDINLGALSKKYLQLHAAELWVETLVAQNTIATIGGRILVGPTTTLTSDLAAGATTMVVKHNSLANGDRVYLEANGNVEFIAIASAPSGSGPYTYTVTRDLDGSGSNQWYAGDAVFNTGQTGSGFIDLYSVRGVKSASQAGPTIVGNVRNSTTYNDWTEHWAIGNLNGLYGYGANTYGVAMGKYSATTSYLTADATNGIRLMRGSTQLAQWDISGNILIGRAAASQNNIYISSGAISIRNNTTERIGLSASGILTINNSSGNAVFTFNASAGAEFTLPLTLGSGGGIYQGSGTFGSPTTGLKIWNDSGIGRIAGYNGGTLQWYANTDGKLYAGAGGVIIDYSGLHLYGQVIEFINGSTSVGSINTGSTSTITLNLATSAGFIIGTDISTYVKVTGGLNVGSASGAAQNQLFIGSVTGNTKAASGANITINIGSGALTEILSFKSSAVAHGMTDRTETNTFGFVAMNIAESGGLRIEGYTEDKSGLVLLSKYTNGDTTRANSSRAGVQIDIQKKSGNSSGIAGTNEDIFAISTYGATKLIVDAEGDLFLDSTYNQNSWDDYDDVALLEAYRVMSGAQIIGSQLFSEVVQRGLDVLARTGVVTLNPDGHHFVSTKGLHALEIDAIRQLGQRLLAAEAKLRLLTDGKSEDRPSSG